MRAKVEKLVFSCITKTKETRGMSDTRNNNKNGAMQFIHIQYLSTMLTAV